MPSEANSDRTSPSHWTPLENRLYRRDVQYSTLSWALSSTDLATSIVAFAPCAGPLAVVPNAGWGVSSPLSIYSLSGYLIQRLDSLRERTIVPFRVVAMGWTLSDCLSVVYSDGRLLRIPPSFRLKDAKRIVIDPTDELAVYDAAVADDGHVTVRGTNGNIYRIDRDDNVSKEKVTVKPPQAVSQDVPNSGIAIVAPDPNSHPLPETLLISENAKIVLVSSTGIDEIPWEKEIAQLALSPNGQYIASLESQTGFISVYTADLKAEIAIVDLSTELSILGIENTVSDHIFDPKSPQSIAWVGSNAIAVIYREHLVLVGPNGGVAVMPLKPSPSNGTMLVCTETDGLRIMSSSSVEYIQIVPESITSVLSQKQMPGNKLMRCSGVLESTNGKNPAESLTRYRLLKELEEAGSLMEATRSCVAAAYLELDGPLRKRMLEAAAYGQRYSAAYPDEEKKKPLPNPLSTSQSGGQTQRKGERTRRDINMIPIAVAILRVTVAASTADVGIPLTKPQFDRLGLGMLVARIARYGHHTLAIRIACFGGISPFQVFSEWATSILYSSDGKSDDEVATIIIDRFETFARSQKSLGVYKNVRNASFPYFKAAEAAHSIGRSKCAELLLRCETRPGPKVEMYLKMGREGPAITASVASGDPELTLEALGTIMEKKSVRETARLLRTLPHAMGHRAADLLSTHLKQIGDTNSLKWVYLELGRRREAALVDICEADQHENATERVRELEKTAAAIGKGHSRRVCHFEVQALQHAAAVAKSAIDVEKKGKLTAGTLRYASDGDLLKRAIVEIENSGRRRDMLLQLRNELHIPERRFFWVCLTSMAEAGDFESIDALSHSVGYGRPPPIGLTAFVDICIRYHRDDEALKYAMRIPDLRERARALARCGRGREAADIASRLRNQQLLEEVQDLAARHVARVPPPPTNRG